jgi:hypothetical protein
LALAPNVYPEVLEQLAGWEGRDVSIDRLLAVRFGDRTRDKVGDEAERDVHIAGKAKDGRLAGLKTSVVET